MPATPNDYRKVFPLKKPENDSQPKTHQPKAPSFNSKLQVPDLTEVLEEGADAPSVIHTNENVKRNENKVMGEWATYPMVYYRAYGRAPGRGGGLQHKKNILRIYSTTLRKALRSCLEDYPFLSLNAEVVEIEAPFRELFHYKDELYRYIDDFNLADGEREHLHLLRSWMNDKLGETFKAYEMYRKSREISWEHLWTLFKPNELVVRRMNDGHMRGYRTYLLRESQLIAFYWSCKNGVYACVEERIAFETFSGVKKVEDLEAIPLQFMPQDYREEIKAELIASGRYWCELTSEGFKHKFHAGIASQVDRVRDKEFSHRNRFETKGIHVCGRVIIDPDTFSEENPDFIPGLSKRNLVLNENWKPENDQLRAIWTCRNDRANDQISDEQALIASPFLYGFSLSEKVWVEMLAHNISDVKWEGSSFDKLTIDTNAKRVVRHLVDVHEQSRKRFRDIVARKGLGRVFLLHGPPGSGKTLTAETISEYVRKPLYSMTSGELGTEVTKAEEILNRIFRLAQKWMAILLIDEADVFLAQRAPDDIVRNAFVSIFLRTLEYYQGIMILTTNRKSDFDTAFESRIHVTIRFDNPDFDQRAFIWKNLYQEFQADVKFDEGMAKKLGSYELNGHEIKNLFSTALAMAGDTGENLRLEDIEAIYGLNRDSKVPAKCTTHEA